jgi:hypothetical protein
LPSIASISFPDITVALIAGGSYYQLAVIVVNLSSQVMSVTFVTFFYLSLAALTAFVKKTTVIGIVVGGYIRFCL